MTMTNIGWLRYTRIGLIEGSSMMPAVGFGTLIPDPLVTKQARWKQDSGIWIVRNATATKKRSAMQSRKHSGRGRLSGGSCSSPPSYGIPIIAQSELSQLSTPVAGDCNSTMLIAISSILPLPFNRAMSRPRGTDRAG
jgi:hypothetical protein